MCAAHGKKYGSFPLTKLHLTVSKSLLTQEFLGCAWVVYLSHKAAPNGVEKPAYAGIFGLRMGGLFISQSCT